MSKIELTAEEMEKVAQHEDIVGLQARLAEAEQFLSSYEENLAALTKAADAEKLRIRVEAHESGDRPVGGPGRYKKGPLERKLKTLPALRTRYEDEASTLPAMIQAKREKLGASLFAIRNVADPLATRINNSVRGVGAAAKHILELIADLEGDRESFDRIADEVGRSWACRWRVLGRSEHFFLPLKEVAKSFRKDLAAEENTIAVQQGRATGKLTPEDALQQRANQEREYTKKVQEAARQFRDTADGKRMWRKCKNAIALQDDRSLAEGVYTMWWLECVKYAGLEVRPELFPKLE